MSDNVSINTQDRQRPDFHEIAHTADYALNVRGKDFSALLQNAARGLYSLIGAHGEHDRGGALIERRMALDALDGESLLVEWLSELAYWVETASFIATEIRFKNISRTHLEAIVSGWEADRVEKLIKAVTYHNLAIRQVKSGLEATVVFDV